MAVHVENLGLRGYFEVWDYQKRLFDELRNASTTVSDYPPEHILLTEHPPVVTLGRHADRNNLIVTREFLKSAGFEIAEIERGGDVTIHSPGQVVMYPIINLRKHNLGVKDYVHLLEESAIRTLYQFGIDGRKVDNAPGVWINPGTTYERKISALGIKCSRFVTMHGLSLNVNNDLSLFNFINPCGFKDKGVTSIQNELSRIKGDPVTPNAVAKILVAQFLELLKSV